MKDMGILALTVALLSPPAVSVAREPVIGGPCEGCELIFSGMPDELESQAQIASPAAPGESLIIKGTVSTPDGEPAEGIIIYAYHTNAEGVYPRSATRHGGLRGWVRTDENGSYRFDTIRPGAYPGRKEPQHVHMHVIEPGKCTYYIDSIVFADDPLLTAEKLEQRGPHRGGDGLCDPVKDEDGVWHVRRDIVLGSNIPGYE